MPGATRETSSPSGGCTKVKSSWLEWIARQIRTVSAFHNIDKIFCQVPTFDSLEIHLQNFLHFFFFSFQCRRDLRWRSPFPQGGAQCMQLNSSYSIKAAWLAWHMNRGNTVVLAHAWWGFKTPAVTSAHSHGPYHVADWACTEPQRVRRLLLSSCRGERQRVLWRKIPKHHQSWRG